MGESEGLDHSRLPRHVGIIMDGNGRWANERGLPRLMGHKKGVASVRVVVEECRRLEISVLTLYAFSTENWKRPGDEVSGLMSLLGTFLDRELNNMMKNDIRLSAVGDISRLPDSLRRKLFRTMETTRENGALCLNLALNYGGRDEIVRAVRRIAEKCLAGSLEPAAITEDTVSAFLDTAQCPDPDLVIRTGGEYRLSNFLPWQAAYAELYVTDVFWPDFRKKELRQAIAAFQGRQRRFGMTGEQTDAAFGTSGRERTTQS